MALGRYISGPRELVLPYDPAIDDAASDFEGYREKLYDRSCLKLKPGQTPTVFAVVPLTEPQKRAARNFSLDGYDFKELVFRCGIIGITNYPIVGADGSSKEPPQPDRQDRSPYGKCASREWMDAAQIQHADIEMVAAMIWRISEARPLS